VPLPYRTPIEEGPDRNKAVAACCETRAEAARENQRLMEQVFARLAADLPEGLRHAARTTPLARQHSETNEGTGGLTNHIAQPYTRTGDQTCRSS
jgi:hypothetical protein